MTAVECLHAVKFGLWHVFTMKGLSWWQRLQLAFLKIIAVLGYHLGKVQALQDIPPGASPLGAPHALTQAANAVTRHVVFRLRPVLLHLEALVCTDL